MLHGIAFDVNSARLPSIPEKPVKGDEGAALLLGASYLKVQGVSTGGVVLVSGHS